jgi:hypothetical protein
MKNTNVTRSEFNALATAVNALLTQLGANTPTFDAPKTTAKVASRESVSHAKTAKRLDDVVKTVTDAETRNRMKLPARMFGGRDVCIVDGHEFERCTTDNNRSLPFSPEVFGADAGDTLTFTHVGKQGGKLVWDYTIAEGKPKRKPAKSVPAKSAKPSKSVPTAKPTAKPSGSNAIASLMAKFGELARANRKAAKYSRRNELEDGDEGFFELPVFNGTVEGRDARKYLTYGERSKFKRACNELGLSPAKRVELLNAVVFAS